MSRYRRLSALLLPSFLALMVCLVGSCQQPIGDQERTEAEVTVDGLLQDIQMLYTINRLDLKPEQYQSLLDVIGKMTTEVAAAQADRDKAMLELVPLLREKRATLIEDKEPGEELENNIHDAQDRADQAIGFMIETRSKYAANFRQILSPEQVAIISGADEANTQASELLAWIRELPAAEYSEEAEANAQELADPEAGLTAEAILAVFDQARKLSETEYQQKREVLAGQLATIYMPMPEAADESLAEWFSNPRLGTLLRERAAKLER